MHDNFTFYTDSVSWGIETKSDGSKIPYVQGYISTSKLDLVNDVVTAECMDDMLMQIKSGNIKLDVEHEAWTNSPKIIPIGKIVEGKRDEKGLWIKAILNKHSPAFKAVWNSIKDGFIDAFSIAFKPVEAVNQIVNGVKARILRKLELINVALTGNAINPEAKMQNVFMKSIKSLEGDNMTGEETTTTPEVKDEGASKDENKEKVEETEEEKKAKEEKEKKEEEDKKKEEEEKKEESKSVKELTDKLEAQAKEIVELKAKLEEPTLKAQIEKKSAKQTEEEETPKSPLGMIR